MRLDDRSKKEIQSDKNFYIYFHRFLQYKGGKIKNIFQLFRPAYNLELIEGGVIFLSINELVRLQMEGGSETNCIFKLVFK